MDLAGYKPTLAEVSALFGKSSRWISELRAKGAMPEDGASLREYVAAWASHNAGSSGKAIDGHKARLAAQKADQAEIITAQLRAELLPRAGVTTAVQSAFARVRGKLLGLPSKIAPQIASLKSVVTIEEAISELVHEALAELAATVVTAAGPVALSGGDGGHSGGGEPVVESVRTTAEADGEPVGGRAQKAKPRGKRRARAVEDVPG
jgi:phage terminase Nu1 subunit (DNA packaging protein)